MSTTDLYRQAARTLYARASAADPDASRREPPPGVVDYSVMRDGTGDHAALKTYAVLLEWPAAATLFAGWLLDLSKGANVPSDLYSHADDVTRMILQGSRLTPGAVGDAIAGAVVDHSDGSTIHFRHDGDGLVYAALESPGGEVGSLAFRIAPA